MIFSAATWLELVLLLETPYLWVPRYLNSVMAGATGVDQYLWGGAKQRGYLVLDYFNSTTCGARCPSLSLVGEAADMSGNCWCHTSFGHGCRIAGLMFILMSLSSAWATLAWELDLGATPHWLV